MDNIEITLEEKNKIESLLPRSQRPIQFGFHAKVNFDKKLYDDSICFLTSHYIGFFIPSNDNKDLNHQISHISLVSQIKFKDDSVTFEMEKKKLKVQSDQETNIKLAQLLYRNYYLSFLLLDTENDIIFTFNNKENDSKRDKLFPPIDSLPISLSQKFQFNYLANCADEELARYNHTVVQYIHNMLTTKNPIFDVSMLSKKFLNKRNAKENLRQIFVLLQKIKTVSGICLSDYDYPEIISTFSSLITNFRSLRIVRFSNCGATAGLEELANSAIKSNNVRVSYWDLSYNKFKNFEPFATVISNTKSAIKYINLNYCEISRSGSIAFFNALSNFNNVHQLHYLSIAKMSLSNDESIDAFRNFLNVADLHYLDLSSMEEEISSVLTALYKEEQSNLQTLILNDLLLDDGVVSLIIKIIKRSTSLNELSLNGSNISPNNLASIIRAINDNNNINSISLNLDNLKLNKSNLDPILDAFSSPLEKGSKKKKKSSKKKSDSSKDDVKNNDDYTIKWEKLSFASNSMSSKDLDSLISAISNFQNLREINLSDNFSSSMEDIENILCRLLELNSLFCISIAGNANNRLREKLIPLLESIAEAGNIQELDIRNNDLKDIAPIQKVIKGCKNLHVLKFDNNGFSDLEKIGSAIKKAKKLTQFDFPVNDCKRLIKKYTDYPELIETIKEHMCDLMITVTNNRIKQGLSCELPFETSPEVEGLITELSTKAHKNLDIYEIDQLTEHSYVSEVFGLPFPCQKLSTILKKEQDKSGMFFDSKIFFKKKNIKPYGEAETIKISKEYRCYDVFESDVFESNTFDSMKKILLEYGDIAGFYPEFFSVPSIGNQIKEMFNELNQVQDEEIESKASSRNKSKRSSKELNDKVMERSIKNRNLSDSEDENNFDDSEDSDFQKQLNRTQKYLIREQDKDEAEDEKSRIQFGNADIREVEDLSLKLGTRCLDKDNLDNLADYSFEQVNQIKKNRSNIDENVQRGSYRSKGNEKTSPPREQQLRNSNEERRSKYSPNSSLNISNNNNNNNVDYGRRKSTDDNNDKDKSIILKKREILFDQAYANSSSDDAHLEKLRRQNLKGSGKRKTNSQPIKLEPEEKPVKEAKKKVVVPTSESSSEEENKNVIINQQRIRKNRRNVRVESDESENEEENRERKVTNRSAKLPQQVLISSSDEESDENNKNKRKRSSNSHHQQRRRRQQQQQELEPKVEEEEEDKEQEQERIRQQERRRQLQEQEQELQRQRKREEELERRRKQMKEQQRIQQEEQEKRRQQQQQENKKQPPQKRSQTLRELLNSTSEEIVDDDQQQQQKQQEQKRSSQRMRPNDDNNNNNNYEMSKMQRPPNAPDPGSVIDYAQNLLNERERKPRPSKIPLYRKTSQ